MLADLHVHTKASDGLYSAEAVCAMAVKAGLSAIAITDHDTLEGFLSLKAPVAGLKVIPGVEISTTWQGKDIHMLGYNVSLDRGFLGEKLLWFQGERRRRLTKIIAKLQDMGYEITEDEVKAYAEGQSFGRPHVAQALISKGYFQDMKTVFDKLLKAGAPAYVSREKITPQEGMEAILSCGGVPVLAHPGLAKDSLELIGELVPFGLKGVEVYYPLHSEEFIRNLLKITEVYSLLATGGSDFHGFTGDYLGKGSVDLSLVGLILDKFEYTSNDF